MSCLEKNLEQIAKYNKPLADKIANHEIVAQERYRLDYSKCDDLNLYIDGIPVHDEIDPIGQAKEIYDKNAVKENSTIIYGLGLGYLFERFVKEQKEKILVYEPNLDILRITLGVFDFSEYLANPKIKIVNDKFTLKPAIEGLKGRDDSLTLYFLPYSHVHEKEVVDELIKEISQISSLIDVGYKELANKSASWALSSACNFASITKNEEMDALLGKFEGRPAVIVSAGPSLLGCIESIKKYRDKIVVISVGIALKTLLAHGIKPDFVTIIEIGDCRFNLEGLDISGLRFILPPEVYYNLYEFNLPQVFNYYTENLFTSDWVQAFTGVDCRKYLNRGTVSITALWSAHLMGCNPLILTGQDLAYSGGRLYSGNTMYGLSYEVDQKTGDITFIKEPFDEAKKEQFKKIHGIDNEEDYNKHMDWIAEYRKKDLTTVKDQNGELIPTSSGYALFVKHFEEIIPALEGKKLINSSKGGAQIDGYENIDIEEALSQFATKKIDVQKIIEKALASYEKPTTVEQKCEFINSNIKDVKGFIDLCIKGLTAVKKFRQQHTRVRRLTEDLKNILNKGLDCYIEIMKMYFTKNRFIMSLSYGQYLALEESLKKLKTAKTEEGLLDLEKKMHAYFSINQSHGELALKILKEQKEKINEGIIAKS